MVDARIPPEESRDVERERVGGDVAARYEQLVGRIRGYLCARYDRLLDSAELDDIAQVAAEAATLRRCGLQDGADSLRYARRAAQNLACDVLRRHGPRTILLPPEAMVRRFADPRGIRHVVWLEARDEIGKLVAAVDRASQELILAWLDCLREKPSPSHREVAERLGWSTAKLERKLHALRSFCVARGWGRLR